MATLNNRGIPLSSINPQYLHTNSTSHTWPFSAVAELIDNAYDPDVSAKQFWIDKTVIKDQDCLIFMDNGKGMDYDKMHKMLSFGFSDKQAVRGHVPVGLYGNGFKSGSMRLGKDAIVFSKKAGSMCVGLLSQTYLEAINTQNVIVPIVMFTKTGQTVSAAPDHAQCLHDILKYSLFNTKEELMSEFSVIDGLCSKSSGTRIIIWNLRRTSSEELELDFSKSPNDIQIPVDVYESTRETNKRQPEGRMSVPESEYSLRAYCSILYLKPKMHIIIQGQKVETQFVTKTLAKVFKDTYKPVCRPALKNAIPITFGYNTKTKEHYGLMMYHKNRLIKAFERVACQRKANNIGVGVIGVIECNYLTPTHNKQDFDNTEEYRKTMLSVGSKLEEYWKEVRYRLKINLNCTEPAEDIVSKPDQTWVQCDDCLKWRKLPDCINSKMLPKKWFCRMNPDPHYRSCEVEEEPEDPDEEPQRYEKTYKQDEKNQKMQEEKNRDQQSLSSAVPSCQTTPILDSEPSDITIVDTRDTHTPSTPTRKSKRFLDPIQEIPAKKTARGKMIKNVPDNQTISTVSAEAVGLPDMCPPKDVGNVDKSTVKELSNEITHAISEEQHNYNFQYQKAMKAMNQLQNTVDSLEHEKSTLLKALEELKREINMMKGCNVDQRVQADFPVSSPEESVTASAEAAKSGRGSDSNTQQRETQITPEINQENNNLLLCKLRELRQTVARLLVIYLPELDLQQVNYDCEVIDEIFTQFVNEKEAASA